MAKMFVHYAGTVTAFKAAGLETTYNNHIVFIAGGPDGKGAAVYTHGNYYGDYKTALADLKGKVDGLRYFSKISDGKNTASVASADGTITFSAVDPSEVSVDVNAAGVKIGLSDAFKTQVNTTLPGQISAVSTKLGERDAAAATGESATAFGRIKNLETIVAGLTGAEGGEVESVDAKITKAINALDVDAQEGDYVASISQVDGKIVPVMETFNFDAAGAADGVKTELLGDVESLDTFGKVEDAITDITKENGAIATAVSTAVNALDANVTSAADKHVVVNVVETDGKVTAVNVTEDFSDITDRINEVEAAAKSYEVVKLTADEVTALGDVNVKEAYKLVQTVEENSETVGEVIKIYKDSSLQGVELVSEDDDSNVGQFLKYTYLRADGATDVVYLNVSEFLVQAEFKNGLQVNSAGEVSVKLAEGSEEFLTVSANGVKLSGITQAINDTVNAAKLEINGTIEENERVTAEALTSLDGRVIDLESKNATIDSALQVADITTGSVNGTIAVKGANVAVKGLGSAAFAETSAFDAAGAAASAEQAAKAHADGLAVNYATAAQGAKADAAAPQATTYTKAEVDAMWAWDELE
jgi:hypothetical protein